MKSENKQPAKPENVWINLAFNVLIPVLLLSKGDRVIQSPALLLIIALLFPVVYFFYDLKLRKKVNFISILGFVSVLLTGGVGLFQLPRFWFIVKETAIPALIGVVVLGSIFFKKPLIKVMILNRSLFDLDKIESALQERNNNAQMDRLLRHSTLFLSLSFFISSILNFILASKIIQTEPSIDPAKFNAEVGALTGWSYLIIALPSTLILIGILFYFARELKKLTGYSFEDVMAPELKK